MGDFNIIDRITANAEAIIREDKEGYLNGYVSEVCFIKRYMKLYKNREYSSDWWCFIPKYIDCGKEKCGNPKFVVFKIDGELNRVDKSVVEHIRDHKSGKYVPGNNECECLLVTIEHDKFFVYRLYLDDNHQQVVKEKYYSIPFSEAKVVSFTDKFIKNCLQKCRRIEWIPKDGSYNSVIKFLVNEKLLTRKALHNFMVYAFKMYHGFTKNDYYANLDVVGEDDHNVPVYYEIKLQADSSWKDIAVKREEVNTFSVFLKKKMHAKNIVLMSDLPEHAVSTRDQQDKWRIMFRLLEKHGGDFSQLKWKVRSYSDAMESDGKPKYLDEDKKSNSNFRDCRPGEKYTHLFYSLDKYAAF